MNYADLRPFDAVNGTDGIATTLFVSGCHFHCPECFNKEAQNFNYGQVFTKEVEDKFITYAKNKHIHHVSLLGGEVFDQDLDIILHLVKRIKQEVKKPIYIWTGWLFENLLKDTQKVEILKYIDLLIDGQFEIDKKDINLNWMGSSNQRRIYVQESLKTNKIIEADGN